MNLPLTSTRTALAKAPARKPVATAFSEWADHRCCWTAWPHMEEEWGLFFDRAREQVAAFCRTLAQFEPVKVLIDPSDNAHVAERMLMWHPNVDLVTHPFGDIWLRDTGPVFSERTELGLTAVRFDFNGWGGKYVFDNDREVADAIALAEDVPVIQSSLTAEGGGLELDGDGVCITTRQCLLNHNRNPGITERDVESELARLLGVRQVIWLDHGLKNDHTDGHVDNLARFVSPGVVVCMEPAAGDPNAAVLADIAATLRSARTENGPLTVITVPSPGHVETAEGQLLPASYMNFYVGNGVVIVPTYGNPQDALAVEKLMGVFPDRRVVGLPADAILTGGGSFHCMTKDVPAPPEW